jgi:cytochrome c-type biogenesis protein CcmH
MIAFWIAAAALSAASVALMLRAAARPVAGAPAGDDASLAVHRRQLAEIDDLAERGLLAGSELKTARAEAGRRLIAAAETASAWPVEGPRARFAVLAAAGCAPLAALVIYGLVGAPGFADQPYSRRLADWRASDPAQLGPERIAAVMLQVTRERPGDVEALRHLALARMAAGDAGAAAQALRRAVGLAPERADLWVGLGETFVAEGQGEVGVDARRAFSEGLRRDPGNVSARYHLARARIADGDLTGGLADWKALQADLPAQDGRRGVLGQEIAQVTRDGRLAGAAAASGPETAGPPTPDMIKGMVAGLAKRLAANPDDPDGWVRLVRSYAVLGDTAARDAALAQAETRYRDQPKVLAALRQAAQTPGAR